MENNEETEIETTTVELKPEMKELKEENGVQILEIKEPEKVADPVVHRYTRESLLNTEQTLLANIAELQSTLEEVRANLGEFDIRE
jgi:hypothetical protein